MRVRFLADQCVPFEISESARTWNVSSYAQRRIRDNVAYPPAELKGIVALQLHNHPETIPALLQRFCEFLDAQPAASFYAGKLLIVEVHRIRLRS
jgi:hypothetical protein